MRGTVIQSGWGRKEFACSPLQMELLACLHGLGAAVQLGIQNLVLETDPKQVVEAIQGNEFRLSLVGGLMHEVKELLIDNFMQPLVCFAPRDFFLIKDRYSSSRMLQKGRNVPRIKSSAPHAKGSCLHVLNWYK